MLTRTVHCESRSDDPQAADLSAALVARVGALRSYVEEKIPQRLRATISPDDVLQDVWLSANRAISGFRPDGPNALDRWLMTIVNNRLLDALRAARAVKRGGDSRQVREADRRMLSFCSLFSRLRSPGKSPSRELRTEEAAHLVRTSLATLSDEVRSAIELRFVDGLPLRDVATRMGKSESAVHSLIFRGLRRLRTIVGKAEHHLSV